MAWNAKLAIEYGTRGTRTCVDACQHVGPLLIQKSFYPDDSGLVHNYLLHPPGGLVGGDRLSLSLRLKKGSAVLLTTPAAGKVYRTPQLPSSFALTAELEEDTELFWLPQENIIYEGAHHRSEIEWIVHPKACLTAWDIQCLGRPGSGEAYDHGRLLTEMKLRTSEKMLFLERNAWTGGSDLLQKSWGLGGFTAHASMIMHWPDAELLNPGDHSCSQVEVGLTRREHGLFVRARAHCPLKLRSRLLELLGALYQARFGRSFALPRIWAY